MTEIRTLQDYLNWGLNLDTPRAHPIKNKQLELR